MAYCKDAIGSHLQEMISLKFLLVINDNNVFMLIANIIRGGNRRRFIPSLALEPIAMEGVFFD